MAAAGLAQRSSASQFAMPYTALAVCVFQRYFAPGQLQFITCGVSCRAKPFPSPRLAASPRTTNVELRSDAPAAVD
jgi:hypothetical protein